VAVEAKRGCGYRKIGGLYFVGGGRGVACDRLPIPLDICPTCGHGIKQTRGFTWVDVPKLVGGVHLQCTDDFPCPLCMQPDALGLCGLLWIGERFYKTTYDFDREAAALGVSRRITAIPRGFQVGKTWILFAHPKALPCPFRCERCGGNVLVDKKTERVECARRVVGDREYCGWTAPLFRAGIFKVWRPERIEKILPESLIGSAEAHELVERGITPVFVPDDDPDHRGTVYDDEGTALESDARDVAT